MLSWLWYYWSLQSGNGWWCHSVNEMRIDSWKWSCSFEVLSWWIHNSVLAFLFQNNYIVINHNIEQFSPFRLNEPYHFSPRNDFDIMLSKWYHLLRESLCSWIMKLKHIITQTDTHRTNQLPEIKKVQFITDRFGRAFVTGTMLSYPMVCL